MLTRSGLRQHPEQLRPTLRTDACAASALTVFCAEARAVGFVGDVSAMKCKGRSECRHKGGRDGTRPSRSPGGIRRGREAERRSQAQAPRAEEPR